VSPEDEEGEEPVDHDDTNTSLESKEEQQVQLAQAPPDPIAPFVALGPFMTPPARRVAHPSNITATTHAARGWTPGGSAALTPRRIEAPWKVHDIIVPVVDNATEEQRNASRPAQHRQISEEEAQAIRERRRLALRASLQPGTPRVMAASTLPLVSADASASGNTSSAADVPHSPEKSGVTSSRPTSPSKLARIADDTDEEDTTAMLDNMRRTVERMRRRSLGLRESAAAEPLGGQGTSPRKHGAVTLLWRASEDNMHGLDFGSLNQTEGKPDADDSEVETTDDEAKQEVEMELEEQSDKENDVGIENLEAQEDGEEDLKVDVDQVANRTMGISNEKDMSLDEDSDDDIPSPVRAGPSRLPPKTPNMADLKHVFGAPRPAPETPAFGGMRELFRQPSEDQATPHMGELRHLFAIPREPETPGYEGVEDMLATPSGYRVEHVQEDGDEESDTSVEAPEPVRKALAKTTTATTTKAPVVVISRLPGQKEVTKVPTEATTRKKPASVVTPANQSMTTDDGTNAAPPVTKPAGVGVGRLAAAKGAAERRTQTRTVRPVSNSTFLVSSCVLAHELGQNPPIAPRSTAARPPSLIAVCTPFVWS
jgi:hypothetical protein